MTAPVDEQTRLQDRGAVFPGIDQVDLHVRVLETLQTLDQTGQWWQARQQGVRPRLAVGAHAVRVVWPVVAVHAGQEVDALDRVHKRVEEIRDEESNELGEW